MTKTGIYTATGERLFAAQWFKNGDHPMDYAQPVQGLENGEMREFSTDHQREQDWSGGVVRRDRHPAVAGTSVCADCGQTMHVHGFIDEGGEDNHVCPGDWIITQKDGTHVRVKQADFREEDLQPITDTNVEAIVK